jgi:acetyl-CoA C-acetyltransferase
MRVAIVGIGYVPARTASFETSYKEMRFEAARRAYHDAGIEPKDVGSFVSCMEDVTEGTSITDEYVPDQLGAVQRPVHTIAGDGLHGVISGVQQVMSGLFDLVLVESYSKASNIKGHTHLINYAIEPVFNRPLNLHPYYIAGLQMRRFIQEKGATEKQCAAVVVKNRANGLKNPGGAYGRLLSIDDVMNSFPVASPLKELDCAGFSDAAACVILASDKFVKARKIKNAIWIEGVGYSSDSPNLEVRDWVHSLATADAAKMAYKMAGISKPAKEIGLFEVDDTFSYRELIHLEALGVCKFGEAGLLTEKGETAPGGKLPVNVSGGWLGIGNLHECKGIYRLVEGVLQLRGAAGERQLKKDINRVLVHSWRGLPTETCCVVVIGKNGKK